MAKPNLRSKIPLVITKQPAHSAGDNVAIDLDKLPWSSDGYRYFLLIVHEFTKFVEIIPMRDQSAEFVKEAFLEGWVYRHGIPTTLLSDQGRNVDGSALRELCQSFGIQKKHSSPYHPEGNGTAERMIGKVKQVMRCLLTDREMPKTQWPLLLNEISFVINSLPNASTSLSPQ